MNGQPHKVQLKSYNIIYMLVGFILFFELCAHNAGSRGPLFWRNPVALDEFVKKEIKVDTGLEAAMAKGAEVSLNRCPFYRS